MADIFSNERRSRRGTASSGVKAGISGGRGAEAAADALVPLVEMLFFAYRDFTGEADAVLETYGLGRAHHRVLHFVNRHPGLRVADLLDVLKITKQSLGRVLRKLVEDGWIVQTPGADDRRERHLTLTAAGRDLAARLAALQVERVAAALREIEAQQPSRDPGLVQDQVRRFLFAMIAHEEREGVAALVGDTGPTCAPHGKTARSNREVR